MKTFHKFNIVICVLCLALLATSCIPKQETMGSAGQTIVKLWPDTYGLAAFDAKTTAQTGLLFEVRRDVPNSTDLNSATTVVLQYDTDTTMLNDYNDANGTSFIPLPPSLGTLDPALSAGTITLNFAAGEMGKTVKINVPSASSFDFSKHYALAFKVKSVSGVGTLSAAVSDEIVCEILAKNRYDGKYDVTANSPLVDVVNGALSGWYPFKYELQTSGANSVKCLLTDPGYYDYYHPIMSGGSYSVYGTFGMEITFDAATGNITTVTNPWGNPPGNTRMPAIDPSGVNKYDPVTKIILFKYWMKQPSLVPAPPNIRTYFDETWTYKGPR